MGNSSSSSGRSPHEETVDQGSLITQGIYTGQQDWNQPIVSQLIVDRKLAPFYRPLEDYNEDWDDDQVLAARKEFPEHSDSQAETQSQHEPTAAPRAAHHHKRAASVKEINKQLEASVYKGAVECPICFLYYPPNINRSRCCDQPICTECFVQIKRAEPTATHLVSEPAACPYCVQDNFGVTYTPPLWRTGIGSEQSPHSVPPRSSSRQSVETNGTSRRKSFSADSEEVVTIDQIRPDWEAKLAAVRAAVARRANRRIIMRQVGDRLIPVGVTSGRIHALTGEGASGEQGEQPEGSTETRGSRRSRRRQQQQQELNQFLGSMGLGGQDLEELMVMEAMRLSLLEHEEQQRREAEKKQKDGQNGEETQGTDNEGASATNAGTAPLPIPSASVMPSTIDPQNASQHSNRSGLTPSSVPGNSQLSSSAGNNQTFLAPPAVGVTSSEVPTSTSPVPDTLTPLSVSPQSRTRSPSPQPRRSEESSLPDPPNTDTSSEPQNSL